MNQDILMMNRPIVRGTDSNSLLRMYDQAKQIFTTSTSQQERVRAGKAVERIARELQNRKIRI